MIDFGVEETVENIYGTGYYTYYIDNTHPDATDDNNPNGTAAKPRKTIPKYLMDLEAGSVVEIHGGPYSFNTPARWTPAGFRNMPVFIRGADPAQKVVIKKSKLQIGGKYFILENVELNNNSHITISHSSPGHVVIRNCEIHNPVGSFANFGTAIYAQGEDIVIYNNHIHNNWQENDVDCHGVVAGPGAQKVWIIDNHIHHNSGNAIQACHACDPPPRFVYIGRNIMHEDRETAIGLKWASDVVISQNIAYGYRNSSTCDGSAIILGADGYPDRSWILFNEIYDCDNGIRNEETDQAWIVGNLIYDIKGFGIGLEKRADDLFIVGNTIYDVDIAIDQFLLDAFRIHIFNNIFTNIRKTALHLNIESLQVADSSEMCNNLFWQNEEPIIIRWGFGNKKDYYSTSDFDGFVGGTNNIIEDPLFEDPDNYNFNLKANSPAIDTGTAHYSYDTFFDHYSLNIKFDFAGMVRPQELNWDIGAFEYVDNTGVLTEQTNTSIDFKLKNYPNPFNSESVIQYNLSKSSHVKLIIYNISGQVVKVLVDENLSLGEYHTIWDGKDESGRYVSGGVYICKMISEFNSGKKRIDSNKMFFIK
jgi:hypothetical protein